MSRHTRKAGAARHWARRHAARATSGERWTWRQLWRTDAPNTCALCGGVIADPADATLDHRLPLAMGGGETRANVGLAHRACNYAKGCAA